MQTDFLGQGPAFPLQTNSRGGIQQAGQQEKIRQSILMIICTQHGERMMRPTFGANLQRLVFAPNTLATANLARFYVEEALRMWEPRIEVEEVTAAPHKNDTARLDIEVRYRIKSTNEPGNLVYPFYLQQS